MHINRLKRAHGQDKESRPMTIKGPRNQNNRSFLDSPTAITELDLNIPSRIQLREDESDNSDETEDEVDR